MEREQATLPFVVPSHLSKLFGLKASVIVEGERAGERERETGGAGWANSTCWGDGEAAVTRDVGVGAGGGVKHKSRLFFFFFFCYIFLSSSARPLKAALREHQGRGVENLLC